MLCTDRLVWCSRSDPDTVPMFHCQVNKTTEHDRHSTLMAAATEGHIDVLNCLLAAGGDPNLARTDGYTALMLAAEYGHTAVVQRLVCTGANPNTGMPDDGYTALLLATEYHRLGPLRALLFAGADPDQAMTDAGEQTPCPLASVPRNSFLVLLFGVGGWEVWSAGHCRSSACNSKVV